MDDICYATTNRQEAVKTAARQVEAVIVVGAANSSNSQRLREVAEREGCAAQLVADERGIDWKALQNVGSVAVTAGASAPEALVERILEALRRALRRRARDFDDGERVDGLPAAARSARDGMSSSASVCQAASAPEGRVTCPSPENPRTAPLALRPPFAYEPALQNRPAVRAAVAVLFAHSDANGISVPLTFQ